MKFSFSTQYFSGRDVTHSPACGASIIELIVTLALISILSYIAVSNIKQLENPLSNTAYRISHYLRLVRARAISQTTYIKVQPSSLSTIVASNSTSCDGTMSSMSDLTLDLDDEITLTATDWSVCFSPRGLANEHITFQFHGEAGTKTVQVALGGGVKIE